MRRKKKKTIAKWPKKKKKSLPVNNGLISGESEHSWFGVPLLRFGRDRADFNKAKSHLVKPVYSLAVLVEAGRNPNGVLELQPKDIYLLQTRTAQ